MEMSMADWTIDRGIDVSSFDVLGPLPNLDESRLMAASTHEAPYFLGSPLGAGRTAGTGRSTESGLEHTGYDSGEEIEAIRRSVTSLRAQRVAVEQLKEKAQRDETTAGVLRRKLRDAESRVEELRAQGGRDVVRRLMNEVSELRARLKATSTAFQTREKSLADLREAVRALEQDRRTAQAQARAQTQELGEQERVSRDQQATIRRLEEARAKGEEMAAIAEKRAEEKCADSGRELATLSSLLREANAALETSQRTMEAKLAKHIKTLDTARKEKESLLFQKGQAQGRIKELTELCERQRSSFAEAGNRAKQLERVASAAKQESKQADKQLADLRARLSDASRRRKEEEADTANKLRLAAGRADDLKAELTEVRAEAAEKGRQLTKHRDELSTFREDVSKLRELAAQQREMRQALLDRDETISDLRQRLELERRERGQWGQARMELLSQFCEEENKLRSTLQNGQKLPRDHPIFDEATAPSTDRHPTKKDQPPQRHSTKHASSNGASFAKASDVAREEKSMRDSGGEEDTLGGLAGFGPGGLGVDGMASSDRSGGERKDRAPVDDLGVGGWEEGRDRGMREERGRPPQQV